MEYAKLINGCPVFAANPILIGENYVGNPQAALYLSRGYKPVLYAAPPAPQGDGYYAELWTENAEAILQSWQWVEDPNISDEDALNIILGGNEIDP